MNDFSMKNMIPFLLALAGSISVQAKIVTQTIEYKQGDATLEGFLAYDDSVSGKRPGVLVVHQWLGLTDYEKHRAEHARATRLRRFLRGHLRQGHPSERHAAKPGRRRENTKPTARCLRARVNAGLDALKKNELVDTKRVAAIGYCFGGTTVIELARSGAELNGVVSFHGGLDSPTPADGKNIKCKVLALAGADDPFQKPEDLAAFENEMRDAKVDWQITFYGGAVHGFTQPDPGFVNRRRKIQRKGRQAFVAGDEGFLRGNF